MALTRVNAESILVSRYGPLMEVAEFAVTIVGTNGDCDDPFAFALRAVGYPTANHDTTTDAEMALMALGEYDDFLVLAEWRLLLNMLGAFDSVDITTGPRSEKLSQFADKVQALLDKIEPTVDALGVLTAAMTAGYISLDFAEHSEARSY